MDVKMRHGSVNDVRFTHARDHQAAYFRCRPRTAAVGSPSLRIPSIESQPFSDTKIRMWSQCAGWPHFCVPSDVFSQRISRHEH